MTSLELVLLGGFQARAGGQPVDVPGRKERALLAFLAMPPGEPRSRDRLCGLLWGDRGDKQAHDSLKQAVLRLRKSFELMHPLPVLADRASLVLDGTAIAVDVQDFERLLKEGTPEAVARAAALYRGDLLDGLDVRDPAFEEWLLIERQRLRDLAREAMGTLVDHHLTNGTRDQAAAMARRLLALDPLRESAHRALMRIYAEQGETALALKQYQLCRDALQGDLGVKPEAETERLYRSIQERRATPKRTHIETQPAGTSADTSSLIDAPPRQHDSEPAAPSAKPSIAVLPFTNMSGDPGQQYFSDGITNDLITDLSRFSGLFVIASNSTFSYKGKAVDIRQVSRELGVRYVLEGSVQRDSGRVRINAQLVDATTNAHLWAKRYDREASSLFAIQDELVEAIVTELAVKLDLVERDRAKRKTPGSLSAYDLWLRSRDHLQARKKEDTAAARGLLEKAVELDPNGARLFADLAIAHLYESRWGWSDSQDRSLHIAEDLAHKGVALDEADYWTHWAMAEVLRAKPDFGGAQAAYERAYALNPNDADLLADFGGFHVYLGRPDEAIRRMESAMRLNPYYPDWYLIFPALAHFCAGNYQKVIDLVHRARQPNASMFRELAAAHIMLDQRKQAEAARASVMKLEPSFTISALRRGLLFKDPALGEHYFAALRKAGFPE